MVLLLLVAAGCSSPAPERVAQRLYERLDAAVRTGFDNEQEAIFSMLSEASRQELETTAARIRGAVGQPVLEPLQCLAVTGFDGRTGEFRPRRVAGGPDRVRLAIGSGASERLLELVDEDGWKLDLEATFELNREVATSVK